MSTNPFSLLPEDLILEILLRLEVEDLLNLDDIPLFSRILRNPSFHTSYMSMPGKRRILLSIDTAEKDECFVSVIEERPSEFLLRPIPDLEDPKDDAKEPKARIVGAFEGVICLLRNRYFIWNPSTSQCSRYFPRPAIDSRRVVMYGFCGFHVAARTTKLFLMVASIENLAVFHFNEFQWDHIKIDLSCVRFPHMPTMPGVYVHHSFYWPASSTLELARNRHFDRILKFMVREESFLELLPPPLPGLRSINFLTNLGGRLGVVFTSSSGDIEFFTCIDAQWSHIFRISQPPTWGVRPLLINQPTRITIGSIYTRGLRVVDTSDNSQVPHPHPHAERVSWCEAIDYQPSMLSPPQWPVLG